MNIDSELRESEYQRALELLRRKQFEQAVQTFQHLSDSHIGARAYLAWLLERGLGCQKDESQALALYQSAAEEGSAIARYFLGRIQLRRTKGAEGVAWLDLAAAQNYAPAAYRLSRLYRTGLGVVKNRTKARYHLEQAAAQGHLYALRDIQYQALMGERGILAAVYAPFKVFPAFWRIYRALIRTPNDPRLAR